MRLVSLALVAVAIVIAAEGRPQLHFTNNEHRAFKSALGRSKALSISRAIPVMAFSDSKPSKFVELPVDKLGLAPFARGGSDIHSAKLIGVQTQVSKPKQSFHETFGRGSVHGPSLNFDSSIIHASPTIDLNAPHDPSLRQGKFVPPQKLHFGFKPIFDGHGQDLSVNSGVVNNFHQASIGNNLHQTHSPVITTEVKTSFQPVIPEFSDFNLDPEIGKFDGIVTGNTHNSFQSDVQAFGGLTHDNLNFDLSNLGKQTLQSFDITPEEFIGIQGSISQAKSGENLFRHHVPSSLVPTENSGPGSKAIGKRQKSKTPARDVFKRTVDDKKKNTNVIVISEHPEKTTKDRVVSTPTPKLISSEDQKTTELSQLRFVEQNGAVVLQNSQNTNQQSQNEKNNFRFPSDSEKKETTIFKSAAVSIPVLPDIQLPLQGITGKENSEAENEKNIDFENGSVVFERVNPTPVPTKVNNNNRQSKQSASFRQNLQLQEQSNRQLSRPQQSNKQQTTNAIPSSIPAAIRAQIAQISNQQHNGQLPTIQRVQLTQEQLKLLQQNIQQQNQQTPNQPNIGLQISQILANARQQPVSSSSTSSNKNTGTTIVSASSPFSSVPPSVLSALGGSGGLSALGGLGGGAGGQPQIIVKTLELDATDADPNSDAFKEALKKATEEARLELGVSSSEELGVGGANLASLFGKRRRKRQLFGGEDSSNAQTLGTALSTAAGLYDENVADEIDD